MLHSIPGHAHGGELCPSRPHHRQATSLHSVGVMTVICAAARAQWSRTRHSRPHPSFPPRSPLLERPNGYFGIASWYPSGRGLRRLPPPLPAHWATVGCARASRDHAASDRGSREAASSAAV